jgi:Arc/MetJ-type ribon-helix-helix transcriptional regulator
MRYDDPMKTATLPSIRVEQAFRDELEASLNEGETISEFIESSVRGTLQRRNRQAEFIARGKASLEEARRTGVTYPAEVVIRELEQMLAEAKNRKVASRRK